MTYGLQKLHRESLVNDSDIQLILRRLHLVLSVEIILHGLHTYTENTYSYIYNTSYITPNQ